MFYLELIFYATIFVCSPKLAIMVLVIMAGFSMWNTANG